MSKVKDQVVQLAILAYEQESSALQCSSGCQGYRMLDKCPDHGVQKLINECSRRVSRVRRDDMIEMRLIEVCKLIDKFERVGNVSYGSRHILQKLINWKTETFEVIRRLYSS